MDNGDTNETQEKIDDAMNSEDVKTDTDNTSPIPDGDLTIDVENDQPETSGSSPRELLTEDDSASPREPDEGEVSNVYEEIVPENTVLEENGVEMFDVENLEQECDDTVQSIIDTLINEYFMRYLFESTKVLAEDVVDEVIEKAADMINRGERARPETITTFVKSVISEIFNEAMFQRLSSEEKEMLNEIARKGRERKDQVDEETSLSVARDFVVQDVLKGLELKDGEDLEKHESEMSADSGRQKDEEESRSLSDHGDDQLQGDVPQPRYGGAVMGSLGTFLHPNSQQMQRFQNVLRAHLEKQKRTLEEEINELTHDVKEKLATETRLLEDCHNREVHIFQQQKQLDAINSSIEEITNELENISNSHSQTTKTYKLKTDEVAVNIQKEKELRLESESLAALVRQFSEWESNQASQITLSKNITDKTNAEKKRIIIEKQQQDMLLLALNQTVLKMQTELKELYDSTLQKQQEMKVIQKANYNASADIDAIIMENEHLTYIWEQLLNTINQRDAALLDMKKQLEDAKIRDRTLDVELQIQQKEGENAIKMNEQMMMEIKSIEKTLTMSKKALDDEEEKFINLHEQFGHALRIKEVTENDLNMSEQDTMKLEKRYVDLRSLILKLKEDKAKLEMEIIDKLRENALENKQATIFTKKLFKLRDSIRDKEVEKTKLEHKVAKMVLETKKAQSSFESKEATLKTVQEEVISKGKMLQKLQGELDRLMLAEVQIRNQVNFNKRKLEKLVEKTGESDLSPEELKLKELEKQISYTDEKTEGLQTFWIRQESHIVSLSQRRSKQLHDMNILRKQLLVLEQKNMNIERDIQNKENEEKKCRTEISHLQTKLVTLSEKLCQRRGYKQQLDNLNFDIQNLFVNDLKAAEEQAAEMKREIMELVEQKKEMYEKVEELQQDLLNWEKKVQMATEMKQNVDRMNSSGGEVATMKNEIHRMEIRYSHLLKVQEKLIRDLELSVNKRDSIVDSARAREKHCRTSGVHYTRQQFQKKLDDLKKRIRQMSNDVKSTEKQLVIAEKQRDELNQKLATKQDQLNALREATQQMDLQLAEGHLHRQKNLEVLVRLQRKERLYSELKGSRYRLLFRNESSLEMEVEKQKKINADLTAIVEALIQDFPSLQLPLTTTLNTLKSMNNTINVV
ncbi:coiled-coil domain-containing protein 40 [Nilaparvata lugens]|uniref:coiled-coil domain-containing protein 40 n=1 Tax=Nilaparvata lugens TaxID=108931 RepID=UPI00193E88DC|nr:coiled-coil domain-containing protein 40 [Nilaparvata lugens]XP_039289752.1 coiled-coil domain-containing protein 40 [Nilaparvata lugens]